MQLRRQHRIAYQTKIRLKTPDQDESVVARVQNLSPHGVFVTATELPEAGTEVICRLDLAGQHRTVRGRVAWVRRSSPSSPEKNPGAGIEFLDLDDRDAELLNRVVEPDPRDSKPVDVWFEGMAAPIRCQAAVLGEGVRLATRLPFLRLNSTVRVNFGGNGGGNEEGTLEAVVLEPSSEDGVPRLQLNVSLLTREEPLGTPLEIDLDSDPDIGGATETSEVTAPLSPPSPAALAAASDFGTLTAFPYASLPEPPSPTDPAVAHLLGDDQAPAAEPSQAAAEPADLGEALQAATEGATADSAEPASNGTTSPDDDSETLIEPGSSPLVSHIVRLGPPPLPNLRHRQQAPEDEKTPTVSDSGSATTIPPMALATPVQPPQRRRVALWGAAALGLVAVIAFGLVRFQGRNRAATAPPPPPAVVENRGPEAMQLDPATGQPMLPPAKPAETPPAPAAPEPPISKARPGTLLVTAAGPNSRVVVPLTGSSLGARRQALTDPSGVRLTLPRGRPKFLPGTYRPAGELFTVQVVRKQRGSELKFLYDTTTNDVTMQLDPRKVILRFKKK